MQLPPVTSDPGLTNVTGVIITYHSVLLLASLHQPLHEQFILIVF